MITRGVIGSALIICLLILAGCASNRLSLSERSEAYDNYIVDNKLEKLDRITTFRFDGWADLSDQHLIISTRFNRNYLITLKNTCFDLYSSSAIKINQTGSVLQAKFDSVSIPGKFEMRCFIEGIYQITRDQKKEILAIGREKEEAIVEEAEEATAD